MALTATEPTGPLHHGFAFGDRMAQIMHVTAASGDTSGTITATRLHTLDHIMGLNGLTQTAAITYSGTVATLAFTVPTSTAATLTLGGVTVTSVATDQSGNLITLAYTGSGTAGAEVVTVTGNAISVKIESGVSTITQVRAAINLSAAAAALVTATGTSGTTVSTATATALTGGITGGAVCTVLLIGA